jgi:hypothetical protein
MFGGVFAACAAFTTCTPAHSPSSRQRIISQRRPTTHTAVPASLLHQPVRPALRVVCPARGMRGVPTANPPRTQRRAKSPFMSENFQEGHFRNHFALFEVANG